jgi:DNA-binding NtrC family response regulator
MNGSDSSQQGVILVIDDDNKTLTMVRKTLEREGYRVQTALDAAEGVKWYEEHWRDVELVLLDFWMPEITGDHVLEYLQRLDPCVRIVLLTGNKYAFGNQLYESGVRGCLEKPFQPAELTQQVQEALSPL